MKTLIITSFWTILFGSIGALLTLFFPFGGIIPASSIIGACVGLCIGLEQRTSLYDDFVNSGPRYPQKAQTKTAEEKKMLSWMEE